MSTVEMCDLGRRKFCFGTAGIISLLSTPSLALSKTKLTVGETSIYMRRAINFLEQHISNQLIPTQWAIGALQANGQISDFTESQLSLSSLQSGLSSPSNWARVILAVKALGLDPSNISGRNLPAELMTELASPAPGFNLHPGLTLNAHAWGSIALTACGMPVDHPLLRNCRDLMISRLEPNGWGSNPVNPNSNDTAAVLLALSELGVGGAVIDAGSASLRLYQNQDGGFSFSLGDPSDICSDAWAVCAFNRLGIDPIGEIKRGSTVFDHMASLQLPDGSFDFRHGWIYESESFRPTATAYALVALASQYWPTQLGQQPPPDPEPLTAEFISICNDSHLVGFEDRSVSTHPIKYWHWDFNDGEYSDQQNPLHFFRQSGLTYTVTLTVGNEWGDDLTIQEVELKAPLSVGSAVPAVLVPVIAVLGWIFRRRMNMSSQ